MSRNTKRAAAALAGFDRMREAVRQISRLEVPEGLSGYDAAMNFDRTAVLFGHRMFLRNIIPGEFAADVDTSVTLFAPDPDRPGELIEGQDPRRLEALKATIQADGCLPAVMVQEVEPGVRFRSMVGIAPTTGERGQA